MTDQACSPAVRLHRLGPGIYRTHDGRYTIGRMELDGIWQVWQGDDPDPDFGQGFATLRDARRRIAQEGAPPVIAMLRDASWFNRPNVRTVKKYHVANGDMAACNTVRMPLAEFTALDASEVPEGLRCRRRGCTPNWPTPEADRG